MTASRILRHITILGGGPAGIAVGYYARKRGIEFGIIEASQELGGICRTVKKGDFYFDTGAHRFHDKDPDVTAEVLKLMHGRLHKIFVPSQIFVNDVFLDFPPSPLNMLQKLDLQTIFRGAWDFSKERLRSAGCERHTFESHSVTKYGRSIAELLLLNYSRKLWGVACSELSPKVSGARLRGLGLTTLVKEMFVGKNAKTAHMDGYFYYPTGGFGKLCDCLSQEFPKQSVTLGSEITRVFHRNQKIVACEINGKTIFPVADICVSTLPLSVLVKIMDPPPPEAIRHLLTKLKYRDVLLVALFLNRENITKCGTVYFPSLDLPYTRLYEPINRCPTMSPRGTTSLIVEYPCDSGSGALPVNAERNVTADLMRLGFFQEHEILGITQLRLPFAYSVLGLDHDQISAEIHDYLSTFSNLKVSGRCGRFCYTHFHDQMRTGMNIVNECLGELPASLMIEDVSRVDSIEPEDSPWEETHGSRPYEGDATGFRP